MYAALAPAVSDVAPAPAVYAAPDSTSASDQVFRAGASCVLRGVSTCCVLCASANGGVHYASARGRVHRASA